MPQGTPDPEAYLRKPRRLAPAGTTLPCDPALATEGVRNGFTPAPL